MPHSFAFETLQFRLSQSLSWFVMLGVAFFLTSCSDDALQVPDVIVEPESFVFLVTLNDEPDLKSLTIVDSLNGAGRMLVPDIPAHVSNSFELIIDRVDEDRANISASQPDTPGFTVVGAGFFTTDSVYIELTIDGFGNRDILSGTR